MVTITLFLQVLGLVLLLLAGLNFANPHPRLHLGWLGLFFLALAMMVHV